MTGQLEQIEDFHFIERPSLICSNSDVFIKTLTSLLHLNEPNQASLQNFRISWLFKTSSFNLYYKLF